MHSSSVTTLNAKTEPAISNGCRFMQSTSRGNDDSVTSFGRGTRRVVGLRSRIRRTWAMLHSAQAKATGNSHAPLSLNNRFALESTRSGTYGSKYRIACCRSCIRIRKYSRPRKANVPTKIETG